MTPTNDLIITIANAKDAKALTKLSITTFRDTFGADNKPDDMDKYIAEEMNEDRLTEELLNSDNLYFLAMDNEIPIGYAKMRTIKVPEELKNNNPIELERLYVLQSHLNKKVGAAIMSHCIAHAVRQKHDVIWLGVWEHNYRAVNFYKRWGFELFGSHEFVLGDDVQTDVLMKKVLK